jgi:hypothetical protein
LFGEEFEDLDTGVINIVKFAAGYQIDVNTVTLASDCRIHHCLLR